MLIENVEKKEIKKILYGYDCEHAPHLKAATKKICDYVNAKASQFKPFATSFKATAKFKVKWIKADKKLPKYYDLAIGRFKNRCEIVWRAKDDDMKDIYTVYNTDEILTDLIDWLPMTKKKGK